MEAIEKELELFRMELQKLSSLEKKMEGIDEEILKIPNLEKRMEAMTQTLRLLEERSREPVMSGRP